MKKIVCDICGKETEKSGTIAFIAEKKWGKRRFDACEKCYKSEYGHFKKARKKVGGRFKLIRKMIKKITGLFVAVAGLFLAGTAYGATSTIFAWSSTNTLEMTAWIYQVWSDFSLPIVLVLGISIGFVLLRKLIGAIKTSAR